MVEIDGKPYAVGSDVARALGYTNPHKAIRDHCKNLIKLAIPTNGGKQTVNVISEDDIYILVTICQTKPTQYKIDFINWLIKCGLINEKKIILLTRKEIEFGNMLEEFLKPLGYQCVKQYPILDYKIDFYIKDLNIAIEYDENEHQHYNRQTEIQRQKAIEKILGCKFIRVSDKHSHLWNCGYVLKEIMKLKKLEEVS